jgi:hypothetical protein
MRTLFEIVEATKAGERPDYEELRYAVCALDALTTFDGMTIMRLAEAEEKGQKAILTRSAKFQNEERFRRLKVALSKSPKEWVGWNNDPDNPEYQERRRIALRVFERAVAEQRITHEVEP